MSQCELAVYKIMHTRMKMISYVLHKITLKKNCTFFFFLKSNLSTSLRNEITKKEIWIMAASVIIIVKNYFTDANKATGH